MDRINIKNLEIFAKHGVFSEENTLGQKFIVSASLYCDLRPAGLSDALEESVDYGAVIRSITGYFTGCTVKLLETAAERLAERLLEENETVRHVWLEIKKPWAPVTAHLETVSVEIERSRNTAHIALGSNMGGREANLRFAVSELNAARGCRVIKTSGFINTAPYGYTEQGDFLNGCLELETLLTPEELLSLLHEIENKAGRERTIRWGPRTLDLDIIFYEDRIMSTESLRIPHPEVQKRDFVLKPLCEIAPYKLHPVFGKTVDEMLNELKASNGEN